MFYKSKPRSIREGSIMHNILSEAKEGSDVEDFDTYVRKEVLYPASRFGFVKIGNKGSVKITKEGSKLLKAVR